MLTIEEQKIKGVIERAQILCEHLECDGATRVISYLLTKEGVKHKCCIGSAYLDPETIALHYWIELTDQRIIDIKFRRWIDNIDSPNGMFKQSDTKAIYYAARKYTVEISDLLFDILTKPVN